MQVALKAMGKQEVAKTLRNVFLFNRVQVDELLTQKAGVTQKFEDACLALEELLQERYQLRDSLFSTYRYTNKFVYKRSKYPLKMPMF